MTGGQPDRAALVTGASSGIGFGIATVLAEEGYALTVAARRPEPLESAAEKLREYGVQVEAVSGNLVADDAVVAVVERHQAAYGRMDVLVNNAGRGIMAPLAEAADKHVELQLDINLRSLIRFTKLSLPMLRAAAAETGVARIVNLSSIAGKVGTANLAVYAAAKHGVIGFTASLNEELAGEGLRATALCPAEVDTPLTDIFRDTIPSSEMIQVADIAGAVRYLLHVSRYCVIPEIVFQRAAPNPLPRRERL